MTHLRAEGLWRPIQAERLGITASVEFAQIGGEPLEHEPRQYLAVLFGRRRWVLLPPNRTAQCVVEMTVLATTEAPHRERDE